MRKSITLTNALIFSITLLLTAQTAVASKDPMEIREVKFKGSDFRGWTMEILGEEFDKRKLSVSIKGIGDLTVLDVQDEKIEAELPAGLVGDYTLEVSTGSHKKNEAEYPLVIGDTMSIVCIDWYLTAGHDNHIHAEAFLQDQNGDPVFGATVIMSTSVDTQSKKPGKSGKKDEPEEPREWLLMASTTGPYRGYNHGESCPLSVAKESGVTDQYCCIGLGAHEPFCPTGFYEAKVLGVQPADGSNAIWDGIVPDNITYFEMDQYNHKPKGHN